MKLEAKQRLQANDDLYQVGDKIETQVGGKWVPAVITKPPHKETGAYGVRFKLGTKTMNYVSTPDQIRRPK